MIIGLSGKKQHGKDTVGKMIQFLIFENRLNKAGQKFFVSGPQSSTDPLFHFNIFCRWPVEYRASQSGVHIKYWAEPLKDIVCKLLNCTREQLEDNEFKETPLGDEWKLWHGVIAGTNGKPIHIKAASEEELVAQLRPGEQLDSVYTKFLTPRMLLQLVGTECGRNIIHPNIWINALMSQYKSLTEIVGMDFLKQDGTWERHLADKPIPMMYPNWVIVDTRFPNEAEAIRKRGGFLFRVERPDLISTDTHESETALDNYNQFTDYIRNTGGIIELVDEVRSALRAFGIIKY